MVCFSQKSHFTTGDNQGYLSLKPGKSFHFSPFFASPSPYLAKYGVLLWSFFWVHESFFTITHTVIVTMTMVTTMTMIIRDSTGTIGTGKVTAINKNMNDLDRELMMMNR